MTLFFYLLVALAVISFSYVFWLRLREDYTSDQIFSSTIIFLFGGLLGFIIFDRWLPNFSFWGFFLGVILFFLYAIKKIGLKLYEVGDAVALGMSWFLVFFYAALLLKNGVGEKLFRVLDIMPAALTLVAFYVYLKNYRMFSWYPSGKIGFIGGSLGVVYFVILALVAIYRFLMLSFLGSVWDALISFMTCLFFVGVVYLRSGRGIPVFGKRKR